QLISADSHILEPPHLWRQYMPRKFHDKAPTVVPDGEGGEAWQFAPDAPPAPIGIYASAGRKHEDVRWTGVTFAQANQGNVRGDDLTGLATVGARDMIVDMAEIIQSGVHDRVPDLIWVAVETGCGWIPYLLEQLDDRWWRNRSWLPVELKHQPSFYFRRNWRAAFMIDRYAVMNRHVIGVENMLW